MDYDVIIIGSGPAGYVAALRAGQLGMKTAIIEKKDIGGMCLNWGCIPTKTLLESAKFYQKIKNASDFGITGIDAKKVNFDWPMVRDRAKSISKKLTNGVEFLLKKNAIEIIKGEAKIVSPTQITVNNRTIEAKNIIIATGSYPKPLPASIDEKHVQSLFDLLDVEKLPKKLVVVGGGPVSVEIVQFFSLIGTKISFIVESEDLVPKADKYLNNYIFNKLKQDKVKIFVKPDYKVLTDKTIEINGEQFEFDMLINANRRNAVLPANTVDLALTEDGFIQTDEELRTNVENIYAVGDVNGKSYLAHVGSAQGLFAINNIQGVKGAMNYKIYPLNIYTVPEMAQIGMTEQEVEAEEINYKISEFPFTANGKALIEGNTEGLVRIISDRSFGEVLGVQIIGANATDMISEAAAFIEMEATIYDVSRTIHAHPTVSEVFLEAGFEAVDKSMLK